MKLIKTLILCFSTLLLYTQPPVIKLMDCINAAINHRTEIKIGKLQVEKLENQTKSLKSKFWPQASLYYDHRNNPVIPVQIVPIGQFNPIPSDEVRAIKFGTEWQQNVGLNFYQPLIDAGAADQIAESKLGEKIKYAELEIADEKLKYEVIKTFVAIFLSTLQVQNAQIDTLRTHKSHQLIKLIYEEGKVLKSELNLALVNHHQALTNLKFNLSALAKERITLSYLTGISITDMQNAQFEFKKLNELGFFDAEEKRLSDTAIIERKLLYEMDLIKRSKRSEGRKYMPMVGIRGFLGANQFTDRFDPFEGKNWYPSSFVGLSVNVPLLFGENIRNNLKLWNLRSTETKLLLDAEREKNKSEWLQLSEDIKFLKSDVQLSKRNIELLTENVMLIQERLAEGQANVFDLNNQELTLQRAKGQLRLLTTELMMRNLARTYSAGKINQIVERVSRE
jgi:outer membrane protein